MQLIFLGTSCAKPTKERNHSAIFLSYGSDGILFDCGEGTQRQLTIAKIKPTKINKIFITHWHGDHVLGLPGMIQTLGISEYNRTLKIYGPKGTKKRIAALFDACEFEQNIEIEIIETEKGIACSTKDYNIESYPIDHSVKTLGFRFIEKDKRKINLSYVNKLNIPQGPLLGKLQDGKNIEWNGKKINSKEATKKVKGKIIGYIPDSIPSKNTLDIAQDADLLICDATYDSSMQKKAEKHKHMTAKQAGLIANQANVKKLILTHYSTRYKDTTPLLDDAKEVFSEVICAQDFLKIKI